MKKACLVSILPPDNFLTEFWYLHSFEFNPRTLLTNEMFMHQWHGSTGGALHLLVQVVAVGSVRSVFRHTHTPGTAGYINPIWGWGGHEYRQSPRKKVAADIPVLTVIVWSCRLALSGTQGAVSLCLQRYDAMKNRWYPVTQIMDSTDGTL